MKLYRIDEEAPDGGYASHFTIIAAIEWELLVEVEKCVHGKYGRHVVNPYGATADSHISMCPGAGLEDTE